MDENIKRLLNAINGEFMDFPYGGGCDLIKVQTKETLTEALDSIRENLHYLSYKIKEVSEKETENFKVLQQYQQDIAAVRRVFGIK